MDFGPALFWTYEIASDNIAQKGIAIRLNDGPGGVSKGYAWMVYDHDTMRVAAATTGDFVDWKGIAFDGSHGTHTSLTGYRHFVNPPGPGWASLDGKFDDPRLVGRDKKRYGPLPRAWAHYEGMYLHGAKVVIGGRVGGTRVLESPGWIGQGFAPVFTRTLNIGASTKPLLLRVAPDSANVALSGDGSLRKENGFWIAEIPGGSKTRLFICRYDPASLDAAVAKSLTDSLDLEPLTRGGSPRWPEHVTTTSTLGKADGPFIADTFPLPVENPWQSWMRPGGFDFTPDGQAAIVATWNGDVWRVDGIMAAAPATLRWRRIASGLFQPLGVKFRGDDLFVACRDQLARLHDLNDDGEIDFIENFNNDHQVTEHFHEFAMGLQTDAAGNFYYAKSARHALNSVVPHHGTLLRVSTDGSRTDILATGFRAANGVCLNDDGTFFVTDQEGHWMPKNRINRVKQGGFYGNIFGYSSVTNTSDDAMEQPMIWITNAKDRSPAELLWVPTNAWGNLGGSLLNLSYGMGRAFIVPHQEVGGQWQGAVCELPLPAFPTGIMRGRFAPSPLPRAAETKPLDDAQFQNRARKLSPLPVAAETKSLGENDDPKLGQGEGQAGSSPSEILHSELSTLRSKGGQTSSPGSRRSPLDPRLPEPAIQHSALSTLHSEGALYVCGMYAWAGNAIGPGGFYRIRRSEKPAHLPIAVNAIKGAMRVTFSNPLDPASVKTDAFAFKTWSLKRTANYGSKHHDERSLEITAARLSADSRTVILEIPWLAPTHCYELKARLLGTGGEPIERSLHGTIYLLGAQ